MREPILASRDLAPNMFGERVATVFRVIGGLHYLKGNPSPYFSLTYVRHRKGFDNQCWSGGAGHELILKLYPRFSDLAKLHLCDMDGQPLHALENGFYDLAGALGGLGVEYHVGNSQRHFPKAVIDPAKPWSTTDFRAPSPEECLQIFADHMRVTIEEAREIAADCLRGGDEPLTVKARLAAHVEAARPRWKAEAEACIANHGLVVYGDPWEPEQAEQA